MSDAAGDDPPGCAICLGALAERPVYTLDECGHTFHADCIMRWFRSKQDMCPLCRRLPHVRMRSPDVFHRARMLISRQERGDIDEAFIRQRMADIAAAEDAVVALHDELVARNAAYRAEQKPRKVQILREYRALRASFQSKASPLLGEARRIDREIAEQRRRLRRLVHKQHDKKRQALRDIGLHELRDYVRVPSTVISV